MISLAHAVFPVRISFSFPATCCWKNINNPEGARSQPSKNFAKKVKLSQSDAPPPSLLHAWLGPSASALSTTSKNTAPCHPSFPPAAKSAPLSEREPSARRSARNGRARCDVPAREHGPGACFAVSSSVLEVRATQSVTPNDAKTPRSWHPTAQVTQLPAARC